MAAVMPLSLRTVDQDGVAELERIALVTGAGNGIGLALVDELLADENTALVFAASRKPEQSKALRQRASEDPRLQPVTLDATDPSSIRATQEQLRAAGRLDLVINTVGVLHSQNGLQPEKRLADINFDDMLLAFDVNALSMMRLAMALEPLLKASRLPTFVSLSARVGSIEDNRLGGWYTYRASKAALNMLLRTLAIEWQRTMPTMTCVALHPGTVNTDLSAPFTRNSKHPVFSPQESASHLLGVIDQLGPEQNGGFYAWDGKEVPW